MTEKNYALKDAAQAIARGEIESRFTGKPYYDPDSDSIVHFREEAAFKAVRVDGFLTVFRSRKTNQVIGIQLKNASQVAAAFAERTGQAIPAGAKLEMIVNEVVQKEYMDWDAQIAPQVYYTLRSEGFYLTFIPKELREGIAAA
jgi:hypothetical protein